MKSRLTRMDFLKVGIVAGVAIGATAFGLRGVKIFEKTYKKREQVYVSEPLLLSNLDNQELMIGDSMVEYCPWSIDKICGGGYSLSEIHTFCESTPFQMKSKKYRNLVIFSGTSDGLLSPLLLEFSGEKRKMEIKRIGQQEFNIDPNDPLIILSTLRYMSYELRGPEKLLQMEYDFDRLLEYVKDNFNHDSIKIISPFPNTAVDNFGLIAKVDEVFAQKYGDAYFDVNDHFYDFGKKIQRDATLFRDFVHLSNPGYKRLREILDEMERERENKKDKRETDNNR